MAYFNRPLLLVLGFLLFPLKLAKGVDTSFCNRFLHSFAELHSKIEPGGWVTRDQLLENNWYVDKDLGVFQCFANSEKGSKITALTTHGSKPVELDIPEGENRIAKLGTEAARKIIQDRIKAGFKTPENFDIFFAIRGFRFLKAPGRRDILEKAEALWGKIRAKYPNLKNKKFSDFCSDLTNEMMDGKKISLLPLDHPSILAMREFYQELYKASGLNLVRFGLLNINPSWNNDATLKFWGVGTFDPKRSNNRLNTEVVSANDRIPFDAVYEIVTSQWIESEKNLSNLAGSAVFYGKPTGDAFKAWKANLLSSSNDLYFVSKENNLESVNALQKAIGKGQVLSNVFTREENTPQSDKQYLWDKILNISKKEYQALAKDVNGKDIVLVEDSTHSGATIEKLRAELLFRGAKSVHVYAKEKVGEDYEPLTAKNILSLKSLEVAKKVEVKGTADSVFAALAKNPKPIWQGKALADLTPIEKSSKKIFMSAFERRDLTQLSKLPMSVLNVYDPSGSYLGSVGPKSVSRRLKDEDSFLQGYLQTLYLLKDNSDFSRIVGSDLGKLILQTAKAKMTGSLSKQLQDMPELYNWLESQP